MKTVLERKLESIRRGIYSFNEVGSVDMKDVIAEILIKDYNDGTITESALNSLVSHYSDQIEVFHRMTLEDVPEPVRQIVSDRLNK